VRVVPFLLPAGLFLAAALTPLPVARPAAPARLRPHRSPIDLAILPDGRRAVTANHTSDSLSLVDLRAGGVLAEAACGRKPSAVACSPDGRRVAVTELWSGTLSLFEMAGNSFKPTGRVAVGPLPRAVAFAADGRLYAAAGDEVMRVDFGDRTMIWRRPAPREPRALAVSADGRLLAAASARSGQVRLWDARTGKLLWTRPIVDGFNLRGLCFAPDGKALVCSHVVQRNFPVSRENIDKGWVIDSRLTRFALEADAEPSSEQVALDSRGKAVGDPHAVAYEPGGRHLVVSAAGSQELLLFQTVALPWNPGDPGDVLDPSLRGDDGKFRRLLLGGRPTGMAFRPGTPELAVANYLRDSVQLVDVRAGKVLREVALGGPARPGAARLGEALFYDARRSHHQWFSCNTCHPDGHTSGRSFDTLNDGGYGAAKLTPSLRGVSRTGPWTWHGWQKDLGAAVIKSYAETMFGRKPDKTEVRAVQAFLATLEHPPSPHPLDAAARRGKALFEGKARCTSCHAPPEYTTPSNYDVKIEPDGTAYDKWNPPTLRGVWDRGPFLHDGRAATLDEVLEKWHAPEKLGRPKLTPAERRDLVAFLKTL
jgi:cytochrome c peroxidase